MEGSLFSFCRVSRAETILSPKAKDLAIASRDSQAQTSARCEEILRRKRLRIVGSRETRQRLFNFNLKWDLKGYYLGEVGAPNRIRTGVLAVRGPRPRPLDDGGYEAHVHNIGSSEINRIRG